MLSSVLEASTWPFPYGNGHHHRSPPPRTRKLAWRCRQHVRPIRCAWCLTAVSRSLRFLS